MRVPEPFNYLGKITGRKPKRKGPKKVSKKDAVINLLASQIVRDPMEEKFAIDLKGKGGVNREILFPTEIKGQFLLHTIQHDPVTNKTHHFSGKVLVKRGGKVEFQDDEKIVIYDSIDRFFSRHHPVSPPSRDEFNAAEFLNQIAHAWGLSGSIDIDDQIFLPKEGSYSQNCMTTLLDLIDDLEFPEPFKENIFNNNKIKEKMKMSLKNSIELARLIEQMRKREKRWKKVRNFLIRLINDNQEDGIPVLIQTGFIGHCGYIIYHRGYFTITNRGASHPNNPSGTFYFTINTSLLKKNIRNREFLKCLVGLTDEETFMNFHPHFEEKIVEEGEEYIIIKGTLKDKLEAEYKFMESRAPQKIGNCTFANLMSAMYPLAIFIHIDLLREEPEQRSQSKRGSNIDYKAFTFAVRTKILEKGIPYFGVGNDQFNKDYLTALKKMTIKIKNYEDRGAYSKPERRVKIHHLCQYYSDKLSTENLAVNSYLKFMNEIIRLHFPGVNQEKAEELLKGKKNAWIIWHDETSDTYPIAYIDKRGRLSSALLPNSRISTLKKFHRKFPLESRIPIEDLDPKNQNRARIYDEVQKLSVGLISSTEEQILLKDLEPGTWFVRESRESIGEFVVTYVDNERTIQTWMLTPENLNMTIRTFYVHFERAKQLNSLYIKNTLKSFPSDEEIETPEVFEKPQYDFGALTPVDTSAGSRDDKALMLVRDFQHFMTLLRKVGVTHDVVKKIMIEEDLPFGTWFLRPSFKDPKRMALVVKLPNEEGLPQVIKWSYPISDVLKIYPKLIKGLRKYKDIQFNNNLSWEKLPEEIKTEIRTYEKPMGLFESLQEKSHKGMDFELAAAVLRNDKHRSPIWLVRESQSDAEILVFSLLQPGDQFSESRYTFEEFLDHGLFRDGSFDSLCRMFGHFISPGT